jgi:hypothetical protein
MEMQSHGRPLMPADAGRLKRFLHLVLGFIGGCIVAAAAASLLEDWAWSFPVVLGGVAVWLR